MFPIFSNKQPERRRKSGSVKKIVSEVMLNGYFSGDEAEQFTYFRIPRQLITIPRFKQISTDTNQLNAQGYKNRSGANWHPVSIQNMLKNI